MNSTSESFDLFAEPSPLAMALIGTSYSADARWNFHGYLQQAFSRDIIDFAEVGQGPVKPMLNYLQSDTFQSNEITYVVWEFPVRYFVQDFHLHRNDKYRFYLHDPTIGNCNKFFYHFFQTILDKYLVELICFLG